MKLSPAFLQHGKPAAHRNSAVFWLLCLIVCYQAGYQIYMSYILWQDPSAIDPWCSGSQGSAQQCVEAQLFRGWQSAGHDDAVDLLDSHAHFDSLLEHHANPEPVSTTQSLPAAATVPNASITQQLNSAGSSDATLVPAVDNGTAPQESSDETPWSKGLISLQQRFEERMRKMEAHRAARRARAAHSTIQEWHNMSTLSRDLKALHNRFGARLAERRDHTKSAKAEFGNLTAWAKDVQALQQHFEAEFTPHGRKAEVDNMTAWSHDLSALQKRMEARMEAHNKAHHALEEMDASIEAHKKANHALEGNSDGHALLDQIAALGREMCSDAKHQQDPKCAQFLGKGSVSLSSTVAPQSSLHLRGAKSSADEAEAKLHAELHELAEKQHAWEKSFVAKVHDTMHDFCSDPLHRTQSTCVQFLHDHESDSGTSGNSAQRRAWHQKFASKIANVGQELCSNPMRREYLICKKILGGNEHAAQSSNEDVHAAKATELDSLTDADEDNKEDGSTTKAPHQRLELHWSTVTEWQQRPKKGLRGSVDSAAVDDISAIEGVDVSRLRTSAHWSGRVPSVACIALVPKGIVAKAWMSYFVDNFRLQHYEGTKQLVLVYHHTDRQAAELVHKYTDGSYIKSAVARGDDFPSAAAFRFGAWLAHDADVIARWDFGAWHHPHRLSMQVRALAFSGRPAGLLERWTVLDKSGANTTMQDGRHWDSSLVGEAAWMRANWYPYLAEERAVFDAHAARDVVKLNAPELEVFDEAVL